MSQSLDQLFNEYEAELREEYERSKVVLSEIAEDAKVAYEKEVKRVASEKAAKAEPDALTLDESKRLSRDVAFTATRALLDAVNAYTNTAALASNLDKPEEFAALAKQADNMNRLYNETLRVMRGIYL
jgi:leucyl aminopeptidase